MKNNNLSDEEKFKEKISTIWKSLCLAEMCFDAAYEITENISNRNSIVNKIGFFQLARLVFWRIGVIEFSKLLSNRKTEDFNVHKLLRTLHPDQFWGKFNVDLNKVQKWEESLNCQKNAIDNVLKLRDEVYVHTDVKSLGSDLNYNFPPKNDVREVLNLLKEIIGELYANVFETGIDIVSPLEIKKEITLIFEKMEEINKILQQELVKQINTSK